jgi:hypothetical protein
MTTGSEAEGRALQELSKLERQLAKDRTEILNYIVTFCAALEKRLLCKVNDLRSELAESGLVLPSPACDDASDATQSGKQYC